MSHKLPVLVVDDNEVMHVLYSAQARKCGYDCLFARDAREMRAILEEVDPALILMDVGLPGKDGLTLVKEIRTEERFKTVPIVVVTAFAANEYIDVRSNACTSGCDDFLEKPIDPPAFLRVLKKYLN